MPFYVKSSYSKFEIESVRSIFCKKCLGFEKRKWKTKMRGYRKSRRKSVRKQRWCKFFDQTDGASMKTVGVNNAQIYKMVAGSKRY